MNGVDTQKENLSKDGKIPAITVCLQNSVTNIKMEVGTVVQAALAQEKQKHGTLTMQMDKVGSNGLDLLNSLKIGYAQVK